MHVYQAVHHLALAAAHCRHADRQSIFSDFKLFAPAEVKGNFGTMDDILARETGDVGAGTPYVSTLNDCHSLAFLGEGPGDVLGTFTAAQHDHVVVVVVRYALGVEGRNLRGTWVLDVADVSSSF
jgi:hypothetical protein